MAPQLRPLAETRIMRAVSRPGRLSVLIVKERHGYEFCGHVHRDQDAARRCETEQRRAAARAGFDVLARPAEATEPARPYNRCGE